MNVNLSFRQLQTFVEVMRTGSVSEAGRNLGRTQPAVSAMIAGLEKEIGFALFERERRRLIAKPEAYYFMEEAEALLERLSRSTKTLREIGNLKKGILKIACNPAAANFFMPKVVGGFMADKTDVEVSLMMRSSPVVADWIASQQYDIGFAETPAARQTIQVDEFSFTCVCAVPFDDPLAQKSIITPNDLNNKPLAVLFDEHALTIQTHSVFAAAGAKLRRRFELRTFLPALQLVSLGHCYTICDSLSAITHILNFGQMGGVTFRPFRPILTHRMSLLTPASRPQSMLAKAFESILRTEIAELFEIEKTLLT